MCEIQDVRFLIDGLEIRTEGLIANSHQELSVRVASPHLLLDAQYFLHYAVKYLKDFKSQIHSGQTLGYGYWHTKFQARNEELLDAWEYKSDGSEYILGANLTLTYWREQHRICKKYMAPFKPPSPNQLVAISEGVLEGEAVQGVRYPSPKHMSGWWLTTHRYSGNVKEIINQHCYHVTHTRPDLAPYIALPYGFRFNFEAGQSVSFDESVANQPII